MSGKLDDDQARRVAEANARIASPIWEAVEARRAFGGSGTGAHGGDQRLRDVGNRNSSARGADADGESGAGSTDDDHAAGEPDGDGGTDGHVHGGGVGHRAIELPVAEERGEHRRGDFNKLHHGGDDDGR